MKQGITNTIFKIRRSKPYQRLKHFYLSRKPFLRYFFNKSKRDNLLGKKPIFIFNHIPKCGGTSFLVILRELFCLIDDYPPQEFYFDKDDECKEESTLFEFNAPNYLILKPYQILAGHYFCPRFSLSKRYPKVLQNHRVKLITFLRDPLSHRVSLYSYGQKKKHNYVKGHSLEEFILSERNNIASFLECDYTNYKQRLDYYFFIGIMERYNESIDILSNKLNMKLTRSIPYINKSDSEKYYGMLSEDIIQKFKSSNHLDYLIYEYSLELLNR